MSDQYDEICKMIDETDIVSFDVFDTLIRRLVDEPETVFEIVGKQYGIENFRKLRVDFQTKASQMAEKNGLPHADIDSIYEYISNNSEYDVDWGSVKKTELDVEKDCLVCNKDIFDVYSYARKLNKRIIITSDMYLTSIQIEEFLNNCGYIDYDSIYVSSEVHCTKYFGDIYNYIKDKENITKEKILHIGDNYVSDYKNAKKAGWNAFHYEHFEMEELANYNKDCLISKGSSLCLINEKTDFWYNLGVYAGGPLYSGLYNWIIDNIQKSQCRNIYFLSRDGYNLYQLFEQNSNIKSKYIYVSRRALLLAGITQLDKNTLEILPPFTFGQSVKQILNYLGVLDICSKNYNQVGIESLEYEIKNLEDMKKVKKLFLINEKEFLDKCRIERENAYAYFQKTGFLDEDSLVFDCGWNGSSQYLLNRFLATIDYNYSNKFLYVGIMNSIKAKKQLNEKNYKTYLFDINKNNQLQERVKSSVAVLELFFGSPEESVYRYSSTGMEFEKTNDDLSYKRDICKGIVDYLKLTSPFLNKYHISYNESDALSTIIRLIEMPTLREAVNIGDIRNVDGFANKEGVEKYIAKLDIDTLKKYPQIEVYWCQGLFRRTDIDSEVKSIIAKREGVNYSKGRVKKKRHVKFISVLKQMLYNYYQKIIIKDYAAWINNNEKNNNDKKCSLSYKPLFSVVVPVYNVLDSQLIACVESVNNQFYSNWELILVDDASTWKNVRKLLKKYEKNEKIKVVYRESNGHISKATNDGIEKATGDYIVFMDCDDIISTNALYEFAVLLNKNSELDFIYSDEDKLSEDGKNRHSPFFKPDWSPDTFMSLMYTNHLSAYRRKIVLKTGGMNTAFDGTQDYDFTLRFMEYSDDSKVGHVPKVLYHWRERKESIASNPEAKPYALEAMKRAKEECMVRRGLNGYAEYVDDMYQYRVVYKNENNPLVSIIIPSKDNFDLLKQCINSLKNITSYNNYEIIVIDNGSTIQNRNIIQSFLQDSNVSYYFETMDFNFSKMCNWGAECAKGEFLLFLNDDIEIFDEKWLERMLGQASLKHVGAVGAKLLYPNSEIIQHVGVTNLKIGPSHMLIGYSDKTPVYFGRNRMDYNTLAVTAACLMVKKDKFYEVGGFDEKLSIAYNDVDFCFKLYEEGYYNVIRNDAVLYHHESASRGSDDIDYEKKQRLLTERKHLYKKHPYLCGKDPFYNVNLATNKIDYSLNVDGMQGEFNVCLGEYSGRLIQKAHLQICIDGVNLDADKIVISGWMYYLNSLISNYSEYYMVLGNDQGSVIYNVSRVIREDVAKAKGNTASNVGFECNISLDDLDLDNNKYQIGMMLIIPILNWKRVTWTSTVIGNN